DGSGRRRDQPADDADQRGLAGAVRAEQREYLAAGDVEVYGFQCLVAGRVGLLQAAYADDWLHAVPWVMARATLPAAAGPPQARRDRARTTAHRSSPATAAGGRQGKPHRLRPRHASRCAPANAPPP